MNKHEAIAKIKEIQNGAGVDRETFLRVIEHSKLSHLYWNNEVFTFGVEHGYIMALLDLFQITREELA